MAIEFTINKKHLEMRDAVRNLAKHVIRPQALSWDREKQIPEDFLRNMARMATSMGSNAMRSGLGEDTPSEETKRAQGPSSQVGSVIASEELAAIGIRPELIRLSVGLEDSDDLIADLDQALAHI